MFRDDQHIGDLAGCTLAFDADLSALREAVLQFGCVTTSRIQLASDQDVMNWQQEPHCCSHNSAAQVSSSLQSLNTSIHMQLLILNWRHSSICHIFVNFCKFYLSYHVIGRFIRMHSTDIENCRSYLGDIKVFYKVVWSCNW